MRIASARLQFFDSSAGGSKKSPPFVSRQRMDPKNHTRRQQITMLRWDFVIARLRYRGCLSACLPRLENLDWGVNWWTSKTIHDDSKSRCYGGIPPRPRVKLHRVAASTGSLPPRGGATPGRCLDGGGATAVGCLDGVGPHTIKLRNLGAWGGVGAYPPPRPYPAVVPRGVGAYPPPSPYPPLGGPIRSHLDRSFGAVTAT